MKVKSESEVAPLCPSLSHPMDWDPYNLNVSAFDIVSEVSETILSSFHSFYFILLFRSYFHHFIFQLTDSSASDILLLIPSRVLLVSVTVLSLYVHSLILLLLLLSCFSHVRLCETP